MQAQQSEEIHCIRIQKRSFVSSVIKFLTLLMKYLSFGFASCSRNPTVYQTISSDDAVTNKFISGLDA